MRHLCQTNTVREQAPTMAGESNDDPGYMVRGKLFAVGYMKGLIEALQSPSGG